MGTPTPDGAVFDIAAPDIATLPLLDTAVGLFGSLIGDSVSAAASVFELAVTIALIIHD